MIKGARERSKCTWVRDSTQSISSNAIRNRLFKLAHSQKVFHHLTKPTKLPRGLPGQHRPMPQLVQLARAEW
jgi:hypothetical protein